VTTRRTSRPRSRRGCGDKRRHPDPERGNWRHLILSEANGVILILSEANGVILILSEANGVILILSEAKGRIAFPQRRLKTQ
jgi:hypothetical protein